VREEPRLGRHVGVDVSHDLRVGMLRLEIEELRRLAVDGQLLVDGGSGA
jgi:hypothetical protein